MITIDPSKTIVTHINVFTIDPDRQQELVRSLTATVEAAQSVPGWISAAIHRSFDGTKVVNYVQFESHAAAKAVTAHLLSKGLIQQNVALGSVAPGQFEVVFSLEKSGPGGSGGSRPPGPAAA